MIEHVARLIAELRTEAGLTQAEVAERIETTVSNYQRIEHGLQNTTIKMLVKIANAIGVPTASFFGPAPRTSRKRREGRPRAGTSKS